MSDIYDGPWRLFNHDPATGRTVWVLTEGERTTFRTDYPVDAIINENAERRAASAGTKFGDMAHIASVPLNIYHEQLAEAQRVGDDKYISKYLNDSDNRAWRTREGKV